VKPERLRQHLERLSTRGHLPRAHFKYLRWLKRKMGFEPKVIYDIGASLLHWATPVHELWPDAAVILFDAFEPAGFLYERHHHWLGVLSDRDGRQVNWYENEVNPAGNSYYRELPGAKGDLFPVGTHTVRTARALDSVVRECGFPPPDFVKIDVQGGERDVMIGGAATLRSARRLIVEMQHEVYNEGAPMAADTRAWIESHGWYCDAERFSVNGGDGDYGFVRPEVLKPGTRPRFTPD
jgi:FkbM family methyltransferase